MCPIRCNSGSDRATSSSRSRTAGTRASSVRLSPLRLLYLRAGKLIGERRCKGVVEGFVVLVEAAVDEVVRIRACSSVQIDHANGEIHHAVRDELQVRFQQT